MKAIRRFSVHPVLPEPLRPLSELAHNLRWSWHPPTRRFFSELDPEAWRLAGGDPLRMLCALTPSKLARLSSDGAFLRRLAVAAGDLHDALNEPRWFQQEAASGDLPRAVAYFSPEFGITGGLPQYSGGLGILAGDHLKAAGDLGVPLIGVGLLYRQGYFRQSLSHDGRQQEHYPALDPAELPLRLLREEDGLPVRIELRLPGGRSLRAHVWQARVGRVPLLLLDSMVGANAPSEREVTDRLYGGGGEHRLLQEMLLGIGGVRAVRAYCRRTGHPAPEVFHTNEGHAGFLGLERIRELGEQGLEFDAALESVRAGNLFTTHTPVPAGIDRFETGLVAAHFGEDGELDGVAADDVLRLGAESYPGGDPGLFNMAVMGLRLAQRANGVSTLHGEVSRAMFAGLWPGFDPAEVPITSVTNGVHAPTWRSPEVPADAASLPDGELWALRRRLREQLVHDVRARLRASWRERGAADAELGWTDGVFDPDVLTIGFARRVPSYKRLTLMLRDRERLTGLLLHPERPVQIVVAGKAHPADDGGKELIQELVRFADDPRVRHRIVFLPDYGMDMAQALYPGCDVWLNNPLKPLEACGTSGMKAALNGALNLSVRDGWWEEWFDADFGWAVPSADGEAAADEDRRDGIEAAALYGLIEEHVAPCFYDRGGSGGSGVAGEAVPTRWVGMVRRTLARLGPKVQAERMVREYVQRLYAPAARAHRELAPQPARELAAWKARVREQWPSVAVGPVEHERHDGQEGAGRREWQEGHEPAEGEHGPDDGLALGTCLTLRARVALGSLSPEDVEVQAVAGRLDGADSIAGGDAVNVPLKPVTSASGGPDLEGRWTYEGTVTPGSAGPFGYTVRVLPAHPLLASGAELGLAAAPQDGGV
ncbi:glycosyltransferase family 1 protein [Streptomyces bathyalis]|uniref:glycogen phosphorylase n=1 Tax=Streptomyces bathyalis TaxID=2710756 RepID=A0A7T1T4X4_9ACTN|nr:alpha-glucan family phosphorylase [Streptomyces bathyalis]QPP06469.1 glycosyltransferase family 1 protein [Streptomyces bathyalis]